MSKSDRYIPALSFRSLTPFYDMLMEWGMRESIFKNQLIQQAQLRPGMNLLDLGCGTGTLTVLVKQQHPEVNVIGLDGDSEVLAIARSKAALKNVNITLNSGMAFDLPYPDRSFDRVLSSLMFHHLTTENKQRALREIFRVLQPNGELHIADFGRPRSLYAGLISLVMRRLEEAGDNIQGLLPVMMHQAGFGIVEETRQYDTIVGGLSLYMAKK